MLTELDRVLASPPRYSGTPLVTFPVRVTDCLWTRLDHSRTAAMLVFLTQGFCLLAPVVMMSFLFSESSLMWLTPDDPPWAHGLAVTSHQDMRPLSPWKFPAAGDDHWLWESDGPPGHPLANKLERVSFIPFFAPWLPTTPASATVSGDQLVAVFPIDGPRRFFRRKSL